MRTTNITVSLDCDAPGCAHCVLAQNLTATWEVATVPAPTLPEGWRERRTAHRVQHACSEVCERALIDADTERMENGPLKPGLRYELQAVLDLPEGVDHCRAIMARDVPRSDWRVTHVDADGVRRWTVTYEPGATFDPAQETDAP